MSGEYFTMFGYDEEENPVVATNVTTTEAMAFAKAKELNGFFLAPQDAHSPSGGHRAYKPSEGDYDVEPVDLWVVKNHLKRPKKTVEIWEANGFL